MGKKKKGKRRKISSKIFERFRLTVRQAYIVIYELFTQWIIHRRKIGILATLDRTWYAIWKGVCSEVRYARETLYLNAISSRPGWMRALVGTRFIDKITNNDRQTAAFESYIVATRKEDGGGGRGEKKWGNGENVEKVIYPRRLFASLYFRPIDIGKLFLSSCKRACKERRKGKTRKWGYNKNIYLWRVYPVIFHQ